MLNAPKPGAPRPPDGNQPMHPPTQVVESAGPQAAPPAEMLLAGLRQTVQAIPGADAGAVAGVDSIVMYIASIADTIPQWGTATLRRDKMLREFFLKEPMLASAVYSVSAAHASYKWVIESEDEGVREAVTEMLETAHFGEGWTTFSSMESVDMLTQDRGAFIEIVRERSAPTSPVLGLTCLEALRCRPTGNPKKPVIYTDEEGKDHLLNYYDVARLVEMPSPITTMRGMQYCAVSRVLAAAQIMRDIIQYRGEKVGGRFGRVLHIVGGPAKADIKRALLAGEEDADNEGLTRYTVPVILASLDPSKPVSHVEIPLASLPDNFDLEDEMKWYITTLSMAFGRDYQDFAPLPGGNLGSGSQSEVMAAKTKGKGPAIFMRSMEYAMNRRGIVPYPLAKFVYKEMDLEDEGNKEKIRRLRAETRATMIKSSEITPEIARMMAVEAGDYSKEMASMIAQFEAEARQRAEDNLRLNAELNADVRQTVGGRSAGTAPPKGPPSIGGAKKQMQGGDFRRMLDDLVPLAAIVHSLRTHEAGKALAGALEKALASQGENSALIAALTAQVASLARSVKDAPAPTVLVQPTFKAPDVSVSVPTQPISLEITMPAMEETITPVRGPDRVIREIKKIIRPLTNPTARPK